jgi:hypothetical protein
MSDSPPAIAVFWAKDLTKQAGYRELWSDDCAPPNERNQTVGLPAGGAASPMGYWIYPADSDAPVPPQMLVVRVHARSEPGLAATKLHRAGSPPRLAGTVSLRIPAMKDGEITLVVGIEEAQVFASQAAWEAASEAILLAIAQYWRFCQMEQEFQHLGKLARAARNDAVMPNLGTWWHHRQIVACDREVRNLVEDWVHFEGLLSDPARYCSSEAAIETYCGLSQGLGLEGWAQRLDDSIEVVAESWEMITEKLLHYKLFVWGLILELVIIGLLAGMLLK